MASFLHSTDLGSDTDDEDYCPDKDDDAQAVLSEEEDGGQDDDDNGSRSKKAKKKKTWVRGASSALSGAELAAEKAGVAEQKAAFEKEKQERLEQLDQQKTEDLWADFKTSTKPKSKPSSTSGSGLGGLFDLTSSRYTSSSSSSNTPSATATSSASKPRSIVSSIFDTISTDSKGEKPQESEPARPRSIVSSIFDSIDASKEAEPTKPRSIVSSIFDSIDASSKATKVEEEKEEDNADDPDKVKITQEFDFAGENVKVTKEVDKDSKEGQKFLKQQQQQQQQQQQRKEGDESKPSSAVAMTAAASSLKRPAVGPGGLSSIMNVISGKKKKMGCLDKSKMDWENFVQEEGIKEELQTHNKGKEGYVEKQEFLTRADLRRFEVEKEAREKTRKTLNR